MSRKRRFRQEHTLIFAAVIFVAAGLLSGFVILTIVGLIFLITYFVHQNRQRRS